MNDPRRTRSHTYAALATETICCFTCLLIILVQTSAAQPRPATVTMNSVQPNGFDVLLPASPKAPARSGLQLEVDSRWINNFGYRPIQVTVTSPKPTTVNHLITVRLYEGLTDVISVEQDIAMPIGSTRAEAAVACPQFRNQLNYWWDVWVDGVKEPMLSLESNARLQVFSPNPAQPASGGLKFLVVGPWTQSNPTTNQGVGLFETLTLGVADLPTRWLDYSCFDVVVLKPSEMQLIARTRPDALAAICRWVRSGGQLWISPLGKQWEHLADVERWLKGAPDAATGENAGPVDARDSDKPIEDDVVVAHGWRPIKISTAPPAKAEDDSTPQAEAPASSSTVDSLAWYVQQPFGLGYVRVYRKSWEPSGLAWSLQMLNANTPSDGSRATPTPLSVALATTRTWESRHGLVPEAANTDFANLLVPGVGLAPVTEFRILITLFALAIGPVNYWLLKRWNRPHLLVLTVPVVAALVTLSLFGYAICSDGFGTAVRVRSFTSLDQRNGEAACWARLSYYAGIAPSQGIVLPDDLVVYPVLPGWNESNGRATNESMRQMEWTDGECRLTQGWLRSRTPTQYLTVRARKTPIRLELAPKGETLSAANKLGAAIQYVAAVGEDGKYFSADAIAEGATVELTLVKLEDVTARLRTLISDNVLITPPELNDESSSYAVMQRRQRRQFFRTQLGMDYSPQKLDDNLMSGAISSLAGTNSDAPLDLPARSYVAITETGPEVVTGIPTAVEDASFHILVGKW